MVRVTFSINCDHMSSGVPLTGEIEFKTWEDGKEEEKKIDYARFKVCDGQIGICADAKKGSKTLPMLSEAVNTSLKYVLCAYYYAINHRSEFQMTLEV